MGRDDREGDQPEERFSHEDPIVDEALDWFTRLRNVTPDAQTRRAFDGWLRRDPRNEEAFRNLEAMWGSTAFGKAAAGLASEDGLQRTHTFAVDASRKRWRIGGAVAAAAVLIAVGAWQFPQVMLHWQADYITATGDRATIPLPDGSTMLLNTASAVAIDFKNGKRQVRLLEGEAFFDVRHDPERPFRVAGHFGETEVKGTAFAVRTIDDEDTVVLERGRVEVSRLADRQDHVVLTPDEMVTATATTLSAVRSVDPQDALAWRDGRIIFENQPLGRVLNELRRYYKPPVIVADTRVSRLIVTGNYRLDNIEGAIRTLADAAGVTMDRLPGGLIILR